MGMGVAIRVDRVPVAVLARRDRIEVDAGGLDGRLGLRPVTLWVVAGQGAPRLHRGTGRDGASAARARYASTHRV